MGQGLFNQQHGRHGLPRVEQGAVVEYENRVWRVGLINDCRARLDPVTGTVTTADPSSGRSFVSYGGSVNIAPSAALREVDIAELDDQAIRRLCRLQEQADIADSHAHAHAHTHSHSHQLNNQTDVDTDTEGEEEMTEAAEQTSEAAPMPVPVKSKADKNKERLAAIAKKKGVTDKAGKVTAKAAGKAGRAKKEPTPCKCGCGEKTGGYFVPGHDARFKGWMLKIERGEEKKEKLLKKAVIDQYKWVKVAGGGERATTNYKGETHAGYDKAKAQ